MIDTYDSPYIFSKSIKSSKDIKGGITELSRPGFSKTLVLV